jgi:hypothetical protein
MKSGGEREQSRNSKMNIGDYYNGRTELNEVS